MPAVQRYTPQLKTDALARLAEAGYPDKPGALIQVAQEFDVPHTTLRYWVQYPSRPVRRSTTRFPLSSFAGTTAATTTESSAAVPPPSDLDAQLEFHRREIARIRALIDPARDYASYKDLVAAYRTFTQDLQTLEHRAITEQITDEKAIEILIDTLNRLAAEADVSQSGAGTLPTHSPAPEV